MTTPTPPPVETGSLGRLISGLGDDRRIAGERYEALRARLCLLFRSRGCAFPDDLADEALDRVARRIGEGVKVQDLVGYAVGVAQLVALEAQRRELRNRPYDEVAGEGPWERFATPIEAVDEVAAARRIACLERCLDELPPADRQLLVSYMEGEGAHRIDARARLATSLGIGMNALRIRVHRLRVAVERCVLRCQGSETSRRGEHP